MSPEIQGAVDELALDLDESPARIHPYLDPFPFAGIEVVDALAGTAPGTGPVFEQHAPLDQLVDAVFPRGLAAGRDLPLTHPEVELPILREELTGTSVDIRLLH